MPRTFGCCKASLPWPREIVYLVYRLFPVPPTIPVLHFRKIRRVSIWFLGYGLDYAGITLLTANLYDGWIPIQYLSLSVLCPLT